ncbi:putative NRPS-like protein biosynthetic cluster [Gnomoniopsis sp. IMI 355080]|nr:putative NRPS-like protein biosynthetic cluster [Gnomoniopsis sp. IMI 355080]
MPAPKFHAQSLTELVALRAETQPHDPAVLTGSAEFGFELQTLTYLDVLHAVDRLAAYYASIPGLLPAPIEGQEAPPERIVAVLTSTAIDESLLEIALAKLGLTGLLLSVNNSVAAVAHLCKQTSSNHLVFGTKFADAAADVKQALAKEGYELEIIPERRFPLWGPEGVRASKIAPYPARLSPEQEDSRTCVILHSSGSTGFPKPVYITHLGLIANMAYSIPKTGFSALPLFHGFGHFSIFRCYYHGKTFTLMPPHLPLTSANICKVIRASPSRPVQHFAVPYVLKLLAETEEGIQTLADFEAVSFAGAAQDDLGDRLVAAGVSLISFYGTTETGALLSSRRDCKTDPAWNWLRVEGPITDYLEMVPQGSDTFEVVVKDGWPAKIASNREDGAYCTKDLMLRHPEKKNWFKYIGRLDDTLTQTLGEKTNPVPIELAIRGNSPLVTECIVFGDGRPQTGALILPSESGARIISESGEKRYIETIWPVIADANANAPSHSRILPEMIGILPFGTDIPVATKMSILRPACYKKFAPIIDDIYERFESGGSGPGQPKAQIETQDEMEAFLTKTINDVLGPSTTISSSAGGRRGELGPETDLFAYGVDSLQATRMRNVINKGLELGEHQVSLGHNIVYEHPSIRQLAAYLLGLKAGGQDSAQSHGKTSDKQGGEQLAHEKLMWDLVNKYSSQILSPDINGTSSDRFDSNGQTSEVEGETVVLTGATGSLGAHILDQLTRRQSIARVICLSRASSDAESLERLQISLQQRQRTLAPEAWSKILSFAANINNSNQLGLTANTYEMIRASATAVVHNAWPVNFNLSLPSFEPHIGGAVNLVNLAQSSKRQVKPTVFFSSSVSTVQGGKSFEAKICPEDFMSEPGTAAGMGYGRSKWCVEKILERAAKEKQARVGVFRIGQLVGDTENGVWNETEAWPLMFRSVVSIKALPFLDEKPSWLPVDLAASAIADLVCATCGSQPGSDTSPGHAQVYHVLNPQVANWQDVLDGLKLGGLEFETLDRREWVRRLGDSDADVVKNPTYKLLNFYRNRIGQDKERADIGFATEITASLSPTIASVESPKRELVALWAAHWRKTGFLQ